MSEPWLSSNRSPGRILAGLHGINATPSRTSAREALLESLHRILLEQLPGLQADVSNFLPHVNTVARADLVA